MANQVVASDEVKPSELNLYQKLAKITGEIGVVAKDGNNTEQNFKFIEYAAVAGKLRDLFAKYGVVVVPRMPKKQERKVITSKYGKEGVWTLVPMVFTVVNADKPEDRFTVQWEGEAMDYGDKATNKAATSALKYYLMRQFNISEKGEDPDEQSPGEQKSAGQTTDAVKKQVEVKAGPLKSDPVSDDELDELRDLALKLKLTPEQRKKAFAMVENHANYLTMKAEMERKLDGIAPPEQTA